MTFNKKKNGFTLIELLVVIAVIGLLAAIVLVSLAGARNRARDARIIAAMGQLRSVAELHHGTVAGGGYTNLCLNADVSTTFADITAQGGTAFCTSSAAAYCIETPLVGGGFWCVDSLMRSEQTTGNPICAAATTTCR